jgi:SEC-C motif
MVEWYVARPDRWATEQRIAAQVLRNSDAGVATDGRAFIAGELTVFTEHGHPIGPFRIRILYSSEFPKRGRVPVVYLESHRDRWRNIVDSHIEKDWKLCLHVPGEAGIDFSREDSLREFLGCLATFLYRETVYQQALVQAQFGGPRAIWPGHQRSHGFAGIAEAIRDRGQLGRNEPCPCGSGNKFKRCCMSRVLEVTECRSSIRRLER